MVFAITKGRRAYRRYALRRRWRYRGTVVPIRRHKAPEQIGAAMQPLLDRIDREGHFAIVRLAKAWPEIVGETIARRTEIVSLKFHTAVVKVSGAMWIQELNLMKSQILARVTERIGEDVVRELRFVQGRLSRRERAKLRTVPRAARKSIELPELKDPELRKAFERLIEAWGRAPR
jgi:predicted nucleic acid-binding Zn ribbon protein